VGQKENENGARSAFFGLRSKNGSCEKMRAQLTRGLNAQNSEVLPIIEVQNIDDDIFFVGASVTISFIN